MEINFLLLKNRILIFGAQTCCSYHLLGSVTYLEHDLQYVKYGSGLIFLMEYAIIALIKNTIQIHIKHQILIDGVMQTLGLKPIGIKIMD